MIKHTNVQLPENLRSLLVATIVAGLLLVLPTRPVLAEDPTVTAYQKGMDLFSKRKTADAIPYFSKAIAGADSEIHPVHGSVVGRKWRALCYMQLGEWPKAQVDIEKAIQLDANDAASHYNLGIIMMHRPQNNTLADIHRIEAEFQKTIQLCPKCPDAHVMLAKMYQIEEQKDDGPLAVAEFRKAVRLPDCDLEHPAEGVIDFKYSKANFPDK